MQIIKNSQNIVSPKLICKVRQLQFSLLFIPLLFLKLKNSNFWNIGQQKSILFVNSFFSDTSLQQSLFQILLKILNNFFKFYSFHHSNIFLTHVFANSKECFINIHKRTKNLISQRLKNYLIYVNLFSIFIITLQENPGIKMQQKKHVPNPEIPAFNIRKVNKKTIGSNKYQQDFQYYTPETDHEKKFQLYNSSNTKKEKQVMLDQTVNEAIINSKAYADLKKLHIDNKKKNVEHKKMLEEKIENGKKQKEEALQERQKLEAEKQKYLETITALKQKIATVRETNERYKEALQNKMSGEAEYISNLIMSMRFQAQYEHNIDPDQMTYEELLELEEKIGVVSKGVPLQLINTLPKIEVDKENEEKCTVCFSTYEKGQVMTQIPNCKHDFHFDCLQEWLGKEKVCPVCKQQINFDLVANKNENENENENEKQ